MPIFLGWHDTLLSEDSGEDSVSSKTPHRQLLSPSKLHLIQVEQARIPQPLIAWHIPLAPEQLGAPPLNSLQFASVSLVVGRPELDSGLCKEEKSFINQMRVYTIFFSQSLIKMLNRIGSTIYLEETPHVSGLEPEESLSIIL